MIIHLVYAFRPSSSNIFFQDEHMKNEVKCNKRLNAIYFGWEQENSIFFLRFLSLLELQIMVHVVNENQLWKKSVQIKMVEIMKIE